MITLCYKSVLEYRDGDTSEMYFKPEFLEWCQNVDMVAVCRVHDSGYPCEITYDFEVSGLSPEDETLWVLKWGRSTREHPAVLPEDGERHDIFQPYRKYVFVVYCC